MLKRNGFSYAALALITVCLATNARAEKTLRWKFAAGQKLRAQLTQRIDTETAFANKPAKVSVDIALDMTWLVDSVEENGTAKVSQTFDSVVLKMTVPPAATVEFDSANPKKPTGDAKELAALVTPLIGAKINVTFSPRGQILDVKVPDETANALAAASNTGSKPFFTKERIVRLLSQSGAVLPEKGVNTGDKWQEVSEIESPLGQLKQTASYTYEGEEDRNGAILEKIRVDSQFEIPAPAANSAAPALKEQSLTGYVFFNNTAGRVAESQVAQKMKTETKVRENLVSATVSGTIKTVFSLPKTAE